MDPAKEPAQASPARERWAFICESSSCQYDGSEATRRALVAAVAQQERGPVDVHVVRSGCLGLCGAGPVVVTYPEGDVHLRVEPGDGVDLAAALAGGGGLNRRRVRAPQWYQERITARLRMLIEYLRQRMAQPGR